MTKKPTYEELEKKIAGLNTTLKKYTELYERSPLPYHSLDRNGNFVNVNPAWLDLLGYQKNEVIGQNYADFLHPDWQPLFAEKFPMFIETGEVNDVHFKIRHKDGHYVDISLDGCVNTDEEGGFLNTNCVFTDITEQLKSQNALEISEQWHRTILETASSGILTVDYSGNLLSVNQSYCEMSGYRHDELLKMSIADIEASENSAEVCQHIGRIAESGTERFESKHRRKDGTVFDVEVSVKYVEIDTSRFVVFISDITTRKKAEEELQTSRDRYRNLYKSTPVMMHSIDTEGRIVSVSDHWLAKMGYNFDEVVGRKSTDFLTEESRHYAINVAMPYFFHSGYCVDTHYQFVKKNGEIMDCELSAVSEYDENGNRIRSMGIIIDVTEKKKLQAQAIRSSQLATLGELSAGVAHEINNPIGGVINYAVILGNKITDEAHKEILDRIVYEGERIAEIVKNLLSFSRIEKKQELHNIDRLVSEPLSLFNAQIAKDGIKVEINIEKGLPALHCNASQIEQVILNLLSNSRFALNEKTFHDQDEKKIHVAVKRVKECGKSWLKIVFEDNGSGISSEVMSRMMDPFYTTKGTGFGTGLGLSISENIVNQHHGKIHYESESGKFTRAIIRLPFEQQR
jgi:PAS domain S-box-containing protein